MTPEQAQAIYFAGEPAVVTQLCKLGAQVTALHQENEALQRQIAKLSKNSSNSSKRPSSDDITKPKGGKKTQAGDACVFQTKSATDSIAKLPPIPRQACH